MKESANLVKCKSCGFLGKGNYCSHCGQSLRIKRISISGILREILSLFTHIEKGILYTLKQLIISPGHMQRSYMEGKRSIHQKPFSMFFISASIIAISRYWIFNTLIKYYHADIIEEAKFAHEYLVLTFIALLPVYTLITYIFFYKSSYNYAEMGVLWLYTFSMVFLIAVFITSLKLIWPHLETVFIEFPLFGTYIIITLINFFKPIPKWKVILKGAIILAIAFYLNAVVEDLVIRFI